MTIYVTLYFLDFVAVTGTVLLLTEASTIFVNIRWFSYTYGWNESIWGTINSGMLALTFFLVRVVFLATYFIVPLRPVYLDYWTTTDLSVAGAILLVFESISIFLALVLNVFWMYKIVQ